MFCKIYDKHSYNTIKCPQPTYSSWYDKIRAAFADDTDDAKPNWPETRKMKNLTPSLIYVGCIVLRPTEFDLRKYQQKDGAAQSLLVVQWQKLFRSRPHHCSPGVSICPEKDSLGTNRDPCDSPILCKRPNHFQIIFSSPCELIRR